MTMTTTTIERLPAGWLNTDQFGEGWGDADPAELWAELFDGWLLRNHPALTRCGNEVIGPVGYDLGEPLYETFGHAHADDWVEQMDRLAGGHGVDAEDEQ